MSTTIKRNKVLAMFIVMLLAFAAIMPVFAQAAPATVDAEVTISIENLREPNLMTEESVTLPTGSTVMDAIKQAALQEGISLDIQPTGWGDYIAGVSVPGHSDTNKYYGPGGSASSDALASGLYYQYVANMNAIPVPAWLGSIWTDVVNKDNYLSEKDYSFYSGWMGFIGGNPAPGTLDNIVLSGGENIELAFTMCSGADLGQEAWVLDENSPEDPDFQQWVPIDPFN